MIKLYTILVRKAKNYDQLLKDQQELINIFSSQPEEFEIKTIVELSKSKFEEFKNNLLFEYDFIKEYSNCVSLVKEEGTSNTTGIIVDPQGSNYARYVGIPMKECDFFKCPRCSKYFIEPPAISRKDNKTQICSKCGMEEALEAFGYDNSIIPLLENALQASTHYNVQIVIKSEGKSDLVINPDSKEK